MSENSPEQAKRGRQPLTIYLSADEQERIEAAALVIGMTVNDYVLQCAKIMSRRKGGRTYTSGELAVISREQIHWSEDELREQGLPLYWSETWLRGRLAEGLTLRQIAVLAQEPPSSVSSYALRVYKIKLKEARVENDVREKARALVEQGLSRDEVAAELGLSAASVGTYALGLPDERQKLLRARIEQAGPWPATTQEIGLRIFGGDAGRAAKWAHEMMQGQHLYRVERGKYDLGDQWRTQTALTRQGIEQTNAIAQVRGREQREGIVLRTHLSAEELVAQNLPPYWSTAWYMEQYELSGRNFEEMSRRLGVSPATLRDFGLKYHGIRLQKPKRDEARRLVTTAWLGGNRNKMKLAQEFGVSIGSVSNWTEHLTGHGDSFPARKSRTNISAQTRLARAAPFPATVEEVAERAFEGHRQMAATWLSQMARQGLLRRLRKGVYDQPILAVDSQGMEKSG